MKISYRTQTLIKLRSLEILHKRGVLFNELVESCDFDRAIVSKCLDSLDDMGLINQINVEMILIDGNYSKAITTVKDCQPFIDKVIDDLSKINNLEMLEKGKAKP